MSKEKILPINSTNYLTIVQIFLIISVGFVIFSAILFLKTFGTDINEIGDVDKIFLVLTLFLPVGFLTAVTSGTGVTGFFLLRRKQKIGIYPSLFCLGLLILVFPLSVDGVESVLQEMNYLTLDSNLVDMSWYVLTPVTCLMILFAFLGRKQLQ